MRADDLNAGWLARVLGRPHLSDIEVTGVGTGQVADSYRVTLQDEAVGADDDAAPGTVVAKLTSDSAQSRAAGRSERNYLREVRFYQEIAPRIAARVPHCHHAEIDSNATEFVLLLEDLGPARAGDQLTGCTPEETELAVREAARFHAPFWDDPSLAGIGWLDISESYWPRFEQMLPSWFAGFAQRYGERIDDADLADVQRFVDRIAAYHRRLRRCPFTVQHGDFRPDNVLFDVGGEPGTLAVVDWQTVIRGPGAVDVAYFVGGALDADTRRRHEDRLLEVYHAELQGLGVDYDAERLRGDYAVGCFANVVIGVGAAMLVERTARGDDLFVSMVTGAVAQARDRDAFAELATDPEVPDA